jgi:hypothetical protein
MSLRTLGLSLLVAVTASLGCGGSGSSGASDPTTAKEKQRQEAKASGDAPDDAPGDKRKGWRYAGDRDECFFMVGHRCFKSEDAACKFAKCGGKCEVTGGGPATVACAQ